MIQSLHVMMTMILIYVCSHQPENALVLQTNGLNSSHQLHHNKRQQQLRDDEVEIRMTRLFLIHIRSHGKCEVESIQGMTMSLTSHVKLSRQKKSAKYLCDDYEDLSTRTVTYLFTLQQHRHNKGASESVQYHHTHIHAIIMCLVRVIIISDNKTIKNSFRAQACDRRNNLMSFAVSLS